jgi:H+/Cl- antiporter ClcA
VNSSPFPTNVGARLVRAGIVVGSLVISALLGVVVSDDFRHAVADLVQNDVWATLICAAILAALTQITGHLAGKVKSGG